MTHTLLLAIWLAFLVFSVPYTAGRRHPRAKPLAAYLVFVSTFSLCAAVLYLVLAWLVITLHLAAWLSNPLGAIVFAALVFAPAFAIASVILRRPPRQANAQPPG
jgi:hypothetical protein